MQKFEEVVLLKTRFHKVNVRQLIEYTVAAAKSQAKIIASNVNIKAMNLAWEQPWYRDFLNKSELVFCDGFGVLLGANLFGHGLKSEHRMTFADFIEDWILACERQNISVFLLAGKPGITDKAIAKFKAIAPNLQIQGHHGYFDKSGAENDAVIAKINNFKPGILFVGFGMPIQERWILDNLEQVETGVFVPMGACLDFYTDTVARGPRWMTDRGLEWLARLYFEPRRLWQRYILGNPLFLYRVLKQGIFNRQPSYD
ncbi:WecB/TagA/CpsF family glycosyltransferase [Aliterella atlantica]|nr:WecB/TagA/CpsF family glycosyltransferase [Aliterella atlantica]